MRACVLCALCVCVCVCVCEREKDRGKTSLFSEVMRKENFIVVKHTIHQNSQSLHITLTLSK